MTRGFNSEIAKLDILKIEAEKDKIVIADEMKKLESLGTTCRQALGEMNLITQSSFFKHEAKENKTMIQIWTGITATVFVVLLIAAVGMLCNSFGIYSDKMKEDSQSALQRLFTAPKQVSIYDYLQVAVSKLVVIGVLIYGLIISAKTLYAHLHNYTVNRHRHNAIASFRRFVRSLDEKDEARKLIIAQVAATVFAPQETGFISGHAELPSIESFMKLMKDVSGSAKPPSS